MTKFWFQTTRRTDGWTNERTDERTDGRIKRIEDVERGADLSFFVARPLHGHPLIQAGQIEKLTKFWFQTDRKTDKRTDE